MTIQNTAKAKSGSNSHDATGQSFQVLGRDELAVLTQRRTGVVVQVHSVQENRSVDSLGQERTSHLCRERGSIDRNAVFLVDQSPQRLDQRKGCPDSDHVAKAI